MDPGESRRRISHGVARQGYRLFRNLLKVAVVVMMMVVVVVVVVVEIVTIILMVVEVVSIILMVRPGMLPKGERWQGGWRGRCERRGGPTGWRAWQGQGQRGEEDVTH